MKNVLGGEKSKVALLYISTLLGVFFGLFSSIINTHFLDVSAYGDVRYVQNIIYFIASLLLFGYFHSGSRLLALSKSEAYSRRLRGGLIVILGIATLILMLSCFFCAFFPHHNKDIISQLFFISIPVCAAPLLSNYINTTSQGDQHIGRLAIARFLPVALYVPIAYVIYKYFGASSALMILLQLGTQLVIFVVIIATTVPSFKSLKPIFTELHNENKDYGFQLYIGSIVMVATNYIAGVTIGFVNQDNTEVGFYTLALTVTSPLAMLPAIIGTTYFKQFALVSKIPQKVLLFTVALTILSFIAFVIVIKPIVTYIYSERYATVGNYAIWLAVGFCIHGIGDMLNRYLGSHGQGKAIRNSSILNGLFKVFGYTCLVYIFNTKGAIITNIICSTLYTGCLIYYYRKFVAQESLKNANYEKF